MEYLQSILKKSLEINKIVCLDELGDAPLFTENVAGARGYADENREKICAEKIDENRNRW